MKIYLALFVTSLLSFQVLALENNTVFSCVTYQPTTSFQISDEGEDFALTIYHHNGVDYLPLHTGTITPNDLPYLAQKAELFKKMGPYSQVKFSKKDCQHQGLKWTCWGKEPTQIGGLDVRSVGFQTAKKSTVYDEVYQWESVTANLSFRIGNVGYSMHYDYNMGECIAR